MVFTEGIQDKYLDEDEKIPSGGNVDLSDYYTKEEIDTIINNLSTGDIGTSGKDGVGIQMVKLVNYELIVTLTDGTEINLGNVRGADGAKGDKGDKGDPGQDGAKGADGKDGINGKDGVNGTDGINGIDGVSPHRNHRRSQRGYY